MRPISYDPGALTHRLTLERRNESPDGCGGTDVTWSAVASIWGVVKPHRAIAFDRADQTDEELTHTITCRFRNDVASGWRLTMDERTFDVVTVHDPDERRRYIELQTREQGR